MKLFAKNFVTRPFHKCALAVFLFLVIPGLAHAADRTWTNASGDGKWGTCTNWSGNSCPKSGDNAIIPATSTSDVLIDKAASAYVLTIESGYQGTITQGAGVSLFVYERLEQAGGTLIGSDGVITVRNLVLKGGLFRLTNGSLVFSYLSGNGHDTWMVYGSYSQTAGTFEGGTATLDVTGPFSISGGRFVSTSGIVKLYDDFIISGDAQFEQNGAELVFSGNWAATINTGSTALQDVTIDKYSGTYDGAFSIPSGVTLKVLGELKLNYGVLSGTGRLETYGPVSIASTAFGVYSNALNSLNATVFVIGGETTQSITLPGYDDPMPKFILDAPNTTLIAASPTRTVSFSNGLEVKQGTFEGNGGTLLFREFLQSGGRVELGTTAVNMWYFYGCGGGTCQAWGNFTQSGGVFDTEDGVPIFGNFVLSGGTFIASRGTTTFTSLNTTGGTNFIEVSDAAQFDPNGGEVKITGWGYNANTRLHFPNRQSFYDLTFAMTGGGVYSMVELDGRTFGVQHTVRFYDGVVGNGTIELLGAMEVYPSYEGHSGAYGGGYSLALKFIGTQDQTVQFLDQLAEDGTVVAAATYQNYDGSLVVSKDQSKVYLESPMTVDYGGQEIRVEKGTFDFKGFPVTFGSTASLGTATGLVVESGATASFEGSEQIVKERMDQLTFETGSTAEYYGTESDLGIVDAVYADLHIVGPGTFSLGRALDVNGNLVISAGSLNAAGYAINIAGNWSNHSSFTSASNTVTFDGTNQTIEGSTDFFNLTKTSAGASLSFPSGETTVISGTANLAGVSGNPLALRASTPGTQARVDYRESHNFRDLDVQDNHNINAAEALCLSGCKDSGNNTNWVFFAQAQFALTSSEADESAGALQLGLTLDHALEAAASVQYAVSTGTATGGGKDYTFTSGTATFAKGETIATIPIAIAEDELDEANETVVVTLSSPSNAVLGANTSHTLTIVDNDGPAAIGFEVDASEGNESLVTAQLTIALSKVSGTDASVDYTVSGGTAQNNGIDYTLISGTATVPAGSLNTSIPLTVISDSLDETDETIIVTLSNAQNADIGMATHTYTIRDDDAPPTVSFSSGDGKGPEDTASGGIDIALSAASGRDISISYTVTEGSATGNGTDYALDTQPILIPAGETEGHIELTVIDDFIDESDETVTIDLSEAENASLEASARYLYTIEDNDTAGVKIEPSGGNTLITEGGSADSYTVVLSSQPTSDVTVELAVDQSAQVSLSASSLLFTAADWNVPQTVEITATDDNQVEALDTIVITHSIASPDPVYQAIATEALDAEITDNDSPGISVIESGGGTLLAEGGISDTYELVLTSAPTAPVTVHLNLDAELSASVSLITFGIGDWNQAQTITLTAIDDTRAEGAHVGVVTHSTTSTDPSYNEISASDLVASIADNDAAGVSISESDGSTTVNEDGTSDTYQVVLTSKPLDTVTISLSADAQLAPDINSLVFDSTTWDVPQTVTVHATDDAVAEETLIAAIAHSVSSQDPIYNGISAASIAANVIDNDLDPETPPRDTDGDDTPDYQDGDPVGDIDPETPPRDTDGDGTPDYEDTDPDSDSIPDHADTPTPSNPEEENGENLSRMIVGHVENEFVYEEVIDSRIHLLFPGDRTVILPTGADDNYTFITTPSGKTVIGVPNLDNGRGRVFFSLSASLSALTDLDEAPVVRRALTLDALLAGERTELTLGNVEPTEGFIGISGPEEGDYFGAYLASGTFRGQLRIVASAPFEGLYGAAYLYGEDMRFGGSIRGSSVRPIASILTGNFLLDDSSDLLFGPQNRALKQTLFREEPLSEGDKIESPFLVSGAADALLSFLDLESEAANVIVKGSSLHESLAIGDVNGDDVDDLIRVDEDGLLLINLGPVQSLAQLILETPDVVVSGADPIAGFGRSLSLGDFTGDGILDIAVGAPEYGSDLKGGIYMIPGRSEWPETIDIAAIAFVSKEQVASRLGQDSFAIDSDGDGRDELLVTKAGRETELLSFNSLTDTTGGLPEGDPAGGNPDEGGSDDPSGGSPSDLNGGASCSLSMSDEANPSANWVTGLFLLLVVVSGIGLRPRSQVAIKRQKVSSMTR